MTQTQPVVLVYMEPTPYILGLAERLAQRWDGPLQLLFVGSNLSQTWGELPSQLPISLLPQGLTAQLSVLRRILTLQKPQLVHLAGWAGAHVFKLALLLCWQQGVPVTVESDTPPPQAQAWHKALLKRLAYPWLFRLPTHFFPGGRRQAAYLRQYGVADTRLTPAQMTVDVKAIMVRRDTVDELQRTRLRAQWGCTEEHCLFLFVGRLEPHKGLADLLSAFRLVQERTPSARLLVVGSGSMEASLQQQRVPGLVCSGRLSGTVLLDAFAAADVFVLPSHFEPWGLVVNEAMASGLPVIVSDRVGCADDLVIEGETGHVVIAGAPIALAQGMQQLLDNADLRKRMGRKARTLISGWTLEHEADIIVADWKRLVSPA